MGSVNALIAVYAFQRICGLFHCHCAMNCVHIGGGGSGGGSENKYKKQYQGVLAGMKVQQCRVSGVCFFSFIFFSFF